MASKGFLATDACYYNASIVIKKGNRQKFCPPRESNLRPLGPQISVLPLLYVCEFDEQVVSIFKIGSAAIKLNSNSVVVGPCYRSLTTDAVLLKRVCDKKRLGNRRAHPHPTSASLHIHTSYKYLNSLPFTRPLLAFLATTASTSLASPVAAAVPSAAAAVRDDEAREAVEGEGPTHWEVCP